MAKKDKNEIIDEQEDLSVSSDDFMEEEKISKEESIDLCIQLRNTYRDCSDYYNDMHELMKNDFKFYSGDQWSDAEKTRRTIGKRPQEVFNQTQQFVDQVVNASKINPPSIKIKAGDNIANIKTVQVMQAAIHQYEANSRAAKAYLRAFENAAICGFGAFRIRLDYEDDDSFRQTLKIEAVANAFDAMIDPNFDDNYDNISYGFITKTISKEEFLAEYPDFSDNISSWREYQFEDWITENEVRIVEYFYITYEQETIYLIDGRVTVSKDQYDLIKGKKPKIIKKRVSNKKVVNWVKSNGVDILEKTIFPGSRIPIIPVFGTNYILDGKRVWEGVVRQIKPAQIKYNYVANSTLEMVSSMSKGKVLVPEGSLENHYNDWDNMNTSNKPYLEYKPTTLDGSTGLAPTPIVQQYNVDVVANLLEASANEMKSITGIYDPSLGKEKTGEVSGIALLTKQRQTQVTNFKYIDSLSDSLEYAGAIMKDVIPYIVDEDTVIKIKDENSNTEVDVLLGEDIDVDLSKGKMNVEVVVGPYGETQRQESANAMLSLMQAYPEAVSLIADKFVENMDWAGADVISKRLKTLLPANLQETNPEDELSKLSPETRTMIANQEQEYQNQIAMLNTQIQQDSVDMQNQQILISNLTAEANALKQDSSKELIKTQSQERIATENNLIKLFDSLIKAGLPINSPAVSRITEMLYGIRTDIIANPALPTDVNEIIIPGVNDPVTLATQQTPVEAQIAQQQQDFQSDNADPRDDILNSLDQNIQGAIPRTTTGNA